MSETGTDEQIAFPRNFVRACILLIVSEAPSHGYEIQESLRSFGLDVDTGGLYRILRGAESDGVLRSGWSRSTSGPERRVYRITPQGRRWLEQWTDALTASSRTLRRYMTRYRRLA